jgi:hypothetical protein
MPSAGRAEDLFPRENVEALYGNTSNEIVPVTREDVQTAFSPVDPAF